MREINIIEVFGPHYFKELRQTVDGLARNEIISVLRDMNVRFSKRTLSGIRQRFNEDNKDKNGELLISFWSKNE